MKFRHTYTLLIAALFLFFVGCSSSDNSTPALEVKISASPSITSSFVPAPEPTPVPTPEPTPEPKQIVATLAVCGDVMSHKPQIDDAYDASTGTYDYTESMKYVKECISSTDFAIANLETTLGGEPYTGYPLFSSPDGLAASLKDTGFDLLSTANNHCMDTKYTGLCRTLDTLDAAGLLHVGTYRTQEEFDSNNGIVIANVGGISVAFLSYTYGTNGLPVYDKNRFSVNLFNTDYMSTICTLDEDRLKHDLAAAKALKPDMIAVMIHWGLEYHTKESEYQDKAADFLIANGADIIIGGHPHVCEPMEYRQVTLEDGSVRTGFVIFSLGNFISAQSPYSLKDGEYTDTTAIVNLRLTKDPKKGTCSITGVTYIPCLMLNRYTSEKRYYLLNANKAMEDYETGDTSIVTGAVYSRLEKAVSDCRKLLGDWATVYDTVKSAA